MVLSRQPLKEPQWIKKILQKRKASDSAKTIEELNSESHLQPRKASTGNRIRKTRRTSTTVAVEVEERVVEVTMVRINPP